MARVFSRDIVMTVTLTWMRWDGRVGRVRGIKSLFRFLVDKCYGKRLFGGSKIGRGGGGGRRYCGLILGFAEGCCERGNFWRSGRTASFSRRVFLGGVVCLVTT